MAKSSRQALKDKLRSSVINFYLQSLAYLIRQNWPALLASHPVSVINGLTLLNLLLQGPGCQAWRAQPGHGQDGALVTLLSQDSEGRAFWHLDHFVPLSKVLTEDLVALLDSLEAGPDILRRVIGLSTYGNLQSLTWQHNLSKGAQWPLVDGKRLTKDQALRVTQGCSRLDQLGPASWLQSND